MCFRIPPSEWDIAVVVVVFVVIVNVVVVMFVGKI